MPFLNFRSLFIICISILTTVSISFAQQTQEQFGKNRVQYKNFKWEFISTYNFDIYYSQGGKELARAAANFAELEYQRMVDITGFTPYTKIKVILYNSASEAQQSNIGLDLGNGLTGGTIVGGQTQFVKSKLEVAYRGTQEQFKKDLTFAISQMMINNMLFGGSLRDAVESSYLLSLPDWFVNGAAAYIAEGWSVEMDNYMRSLIINKQIKKPSHLVGKEATLLGQSIWNYIGEKYGKENISNILNLTRVVRSEETGIESGLGVLFSNFIRDWNSYYVSMAAKLSENYIEIPRTDRILHNRNNKYLLDLKSSPDGKTISFVRNNQGRYKLVTYNLENKKFNTIASGGRKLLHQQADLNSLKHTWMPGNKVAYIESKRGINYLTFLDDNFKKLNRRALKEFSQINSIAASDDGNRILMSADKDGQTDIYLYDISSHTYKQLTNDLFDDVMPIFVSNSQQILFSSNRANDTLGKEVFSFKNVTSEYSLFLLNPGVRNQVLTRVSENGKNFAVKADSKEITYISDEKGIRNLYSYVINTGERTQISNFILSTDEAIVFPSSLVTLSWYRGKQMIFNIPEFSFEPVKDAVLTNRQLAYEVAHPRKKSTIDIDTTSIEETEINIQEYKFESDIKKQKKQTPDQSHIAKTKVAEKKEEIKFKGPLPYQNLFGIERVNSTFMVDPLRGTGVLLEADMGDMLGNHRMNAGLFGLTDLKSSSVFGEYYYLKHRIDYKLRYDRKVIYAASESLAQRYTSNNFIATASYPFSTTSRISVSPFLTSTRFTDLTDGQNFVRDQTTLYRGLQTQFVFDNSTVTGINMMEGTRAKVNLEKYVAGDKQLNFNKFTIDIRHYQPIHRSLVFATRASYGEFFGNSPKKFLLGGMDNWLFNSTSNPGGADPLTLLPLQNNRDLLFVEYVTNMRGFSYNTQYGNKYLLFNAELRWPFVKYFYRGVINSNFLKNMQAIGFTDFGAAWSGKNPFSTNNSTNQTQIGGGSSDFSANVTNFRNPFLWGYGIGLRTMFLGYYIKGDFAWAVQDYKLQGTKFYFTFGHDF